MSDAAVIQATFADWRTVKGRKQLQLIFEVPLEMQGEVLKMLGAPVQSNPRWYAIAEIMTEQELVNGLEKQGLIQPEPSKTRQALEASVAKERRSWPDLPPTTQAGIRCNEPAFQKWVVEEKQFSEVEDDPESNAACYVRKICGVNTRGALSTNETAGAKWAGIESEFTIWSTM